MRERDTAIRVHLHAMHIVLIPGAIRLRPFGRAARRDAPPRLAAKEGERTMDGRSRGWQLVIGCLVIAAAGCATRSSVSYGKHLVRAQDLAPEVLERFASFSARPKGQPGVVVDTEDWKGDVLRASSQ